MPPFERGHVAGAQKRTRTSKGLLPLAPQASAYTIPPPVREHTER